MINKISRNELRRKRHRRSRRKLVGSSEAPRLVVFRSNKNIYAQVIDDSQGKTLVCANSLQASVAEQIKDDMSPKDIAGLVGKIVADNALKAGIETVVFDRAGYKYHGRVAALADAARKAGLKF